MVWMIVLKNGYINCNPFYFNSYFIYCIESVFCHSTKTDSIENLTSACYTKILFSYTKVLLIVCNVLFRYSKILHLSSNKTELVWLISTTIPLFEFKFLALFIVCIILALILLPFNIILLFTRKFSHIKLVTNIECRNRYINVFFINLGFMVIFHSSSMYIKMSIISNLSLQSL